MSTFERARAAGRVTTSEAQELFDGLDAVPVEFMFGVAKPLVGTSRPTARLRMTEYRGRVSATMIYDAKPINDVFRKVTGDTVLGAMDLRGADRPYFFVLHRDDTTPVLG